MKFLNIVGLTIFSAGILMLIGFSTYEFLKDSNIPVVVRWGIIAVILGIAIILVSLIKERVKEKKL